MLFQRMTDWPTWGGLRPFEELERMRRQMERLTEGLTRGLWREPISGVFPLLNVTEDKENFYVRAELPGVKAEDLELSVTGDSLTLSGERKIAAEDENARYHRREREAGKFSRIVTLPAQVEPAKVEASCADGVLTVVLPKAEASKPKTISVKSS
ncbi:MAG: Hsp20/alpha crystallin family protein [Deltaproteobacteria bacterium]|nr:Hsp20/alpha crystallin family protein [Deltaproteobacteria bacterium]MBW1924842.1 Hsp20/alpha crystallin family protein [Deltaproteobacteria bacterium]MBW1950486.1 Hsp20/alpha crystallin family protein [Deltaproteobacteria bacterium]MBW2008065.1 Hsp20/alpha crystallin family protein [Deltaproteobacteria bacterium]MBW2102136.1 Hsp20/alpha crystallin family protein [Deltaproteobacteria bacterium]